jgi:hypothetical protein
MAMEHPFITREVYGGPFEPKRNEERNSDNNHTGGEDTMSE